MGDSIHLDRDYSTNGIKIPAGKISTDDLRELIKDDKGNHITEEEAKSVQQDLLRRQGTYAAYAKGIHERREVTHDSGSMAVGGSE
jgi:hypothetical protein